MLSYLASTQFAKSASHSIVQLITTPDPYKITTMMIESRNTDTRYILNIVTVTGFIVVTSGRKKMPTKFKL